MAFTIDVAAAGKDSVKTSGTTLAVTPGSTLAAGKLALLAATFDNVTVLADGDSTEGSVTDSQGNTWTRAKEFVNGLLADTGVVSGLWYSVLATALGTGDTVTLTLVNAVTAKGAGLASFTIGTSAVEVAAAGGQAVDNSGDFSVTVNPTNSAETLYVAVRGYENGATSGTINIDAAYSLLSAGGTPTDRFGTTGGAGHTNVAAKWGYLIETSSTQTFDATGDSSTDLSTVLVAFREVAGGATHERSAAIGATADITTVGTFFSVFLRSTAIDAVGAFEVTGQRDLIRSVLIDAGTLIQVADFERDLVRATTIDAVASVEVVGQRDLLRSAAIGATASIESNGFGILERSVTIDAVAGIASAGEFFGLIERAAAIDAVIDLSVAGQRDLLRSTAIDAVASLEIAGQRELIRSATVDATASIVIAGARDLLRAVTIDALADVSVAGLIPLPSLIAGYAGSPYAQAPYAGQTVEIVGVIERSASFSAAASLEVADFERDLARSAAIDVVASINVAAQKDLFRSVLINAIADVASSGEIDSPGVFERSASFDVVASLETGHERELMRSALIDATALLEVTGIGVLERSIAIDALAALETSPQRELLRSILVGAVAGIEASGEVGTGAIIERAIVIDALTALDVRFQHIYIRRGSTDSGNDRRGLVGVGSLRRGPVTPPTQ